MPLSWPPLAFQGETPITIARESPGEDNTDMLSGIDEDHVQGSDYNSSDDDNVPDYYSSPVEGAREGLDEEDEASEDRNANQDLYDSPASPSEAKERSREASPSLDTDGEREEDIDLRDWLHSLLETDREHVSDDALIHHVLTELPRRTQHNLAANDSGGQEQHSGKSSPRQRAEIDKKGFRRPTDAFLAKNREKAAVPGGSSRRASTSFKMLVHDRYGERATQESAEIPAARRPPLQRSITEISGPRPTSSRSFRNGIKERSKEQLGSAALDRQGGSHLEFPAIPGEGISTAASTPLRGRSRQGQRIRRMGTLADMRIQREAVTTDTSSLEHEVGRSLESLERMKITQRSLEREIEKERRKNEELARGLEESRERYKKQNDGLNAELRKEKQAKEQVEDELAKLRRETGTAAEIAVSEDRIRDQTDRLEEQELQIPNLKDELAKAKEAESALRIEMRDAKAQADERIRNLEVSLAQAATPKNISSLDKNLNEEIRMGEDEYQKWNALYEAESKRYAKLKIAHDKLKIEAKKLLEGWSELQRDNRSLTQELDRCREHGMCLEEELALYKEAAAQWEAEYHEKAELCDKQRIEREEHFETQMKDLLECMKAYHDKMPGKDPDWWHIGGLRKKVECMQKELKDVRERLEQVKSEKAIAYEHIEKLMDEKTELLAENERLRLSAPLSPPPSEDGNTASKKNRKERDTAAKYASWFNSPEAMQKSKQLMEDFKEKQRLARKEKAVAQGLLEKVRRLKMGSYYPPLNQGWDDSLKKTSWERWKGERWSREVARAQDVKRLRDTELQT